jgi:hypothetical protein
MKDKTVELGAFFDHCKRGMQSPAAISPVSPVAPVPKGNKLVFFSRFLHTQVICSCFNG